MILLYKIAQTVYLSQKEGHMDDDKPQGGIVVSLKEIGQLMESLSTKEEECIALIRQRDELLHYNSELTEDWQHERTANEILKKQRQRLQRANQKYQTENEDMFATLIKCVLVISIMFFTPIFFYLIGSFTPKVTLFLLTVFNFIILSIVFVYLGYRLILKIKTKYYNAAL